MFELCGNVIHQGTVFAVTAQVVPFIAEIACADTVAVDTRHFAIDYLRHIVVGQTEWPAKVDLEELEHGPSAILASIDAVESEVPRLLPLLETELAAPTIGLLATIQRVAASIAPSLWKIARTRADVPLGGMALVALARLGQPEVASAARVMCDAIDSAHVGAVYAAVADLLDSPGESVSSVAMNVLLSVPDAWAKMDSPFGSTVESTISPLRTWLPRSARAQLIKRFAVKLRGLPEHQKIHVFSEMIEMVELDGEMPLDALHREVIRLIVDHFPTNNSYEPTLRSLFKSARLPSDRYQLQLLGRG